MIRSIAIAASMFLAIGSAVAEPLVIGAGADGGGYDRKAEELVSRLSNVSLDAEVSNYAGSGAITLAACSGGVDVWISQIDAIYARAKEGCQLQPVAQYSQSHEVAVLLFPPDSKASELDDLTSASRVGVDGIDSGTELFWKTIVEIEKEHGRGNEWSKARPVNTTPETLHMMYEFGDIDAAVLVRLPGSPQVQQLLDLGWTTGYLYDRDINDLQFNNKPLYESVEFPYLNSKGKSKKEWGYEVRSFIGVSPELAKDRSTLTTIQQVANR